MPEQTKAKLRMKYEPTLLIDIGYILVHTLPSKEVPSTGISEYAHKPLHNQGRFTKPSNLETV